jgi:hypothetical protein
VWLLLYGPCDRRTRGMLVYIVYVAFTEAYYCEAIL